MSAFDEIMAERTARGSNIIHACITTAIDKNGKELFFKALGYNGVGPDAPPVDPNATFWIASCTKLIGTIAALQCVERGQITLDEPVENVLPELANPGILNPGPDGTGWDPAFATTPAKTKITLRHLLTHTAGLAYDRSHPALAAWRFSRGEDLIGISGSCVKAHTLPLLYEPGEGWSYGGGIDWAGELVARLNNTTLEEYLQENMFKPLRMTSTTFRLEKRPDIKARLLKTVERVDGALKDSVKLWPDRAAEDCGGAGLYTSVTDFVKVLHDLIRDEPTLLMKETVENEMFHAHFAPDSATLRKLTASADIVAAMTKTTETKGINYGLGGMYAEGAVGTVPKGTLVWGGLPNLVWFMNREKGVAAFFATQVLPPGDRQCGELVGEVVEEVFRHSIA
ncbi:hypothetical protein jhhlp_004978 [Lomentospora prolificans]|uniref:Beta-lactamase-related domain-containing protein n=1 Tax=Lomentospora prolificans TaxID=41688 RepID=A0A2N3N8B0_9PEZI|nr:hypothetical protein jhhlp_004978 [Lomentospora prolificans]